MDAASMITARILADSVNTVGDRLTTFALEYPRFIHPEVLTHRVFSRNSSSSRAIPVTRRIAQVRTNPVTPVEWYRDTPGMASRKLLMGLDRQHADEIWRELAQRTARACEQLVAIGVHKSIANRPLEPFVTVKTLITATDDAWPNFFALRDHPDAQPEFQQLAALMRDTCDDSTPVVCEPGEWHIPFGDRMPATATVDTCLKIATARCARLSYETHDGDFSVEKDVALHDRLVADGHWSPFEHSALALGSHKRVKNFRGWMQYRALIPGETVREMPPNPRRTAVREAVEGG